MLVLFVAECWPALTFPYDIDPSDGEVLSSALRVGRGLPLYGDWTQGEIFGLYTPLYYVYLAIGALLAVDPTTFGRVSNVIFIVSSAFAAAALARRSSRPSEYGAFAFFVTAWLVFRRAWPMVPNLDATPFLWSVTLRGDALSLVLALAASWLVCTRPSHASWVGVLAVAAAMAKQQAAVVVAAFAVYYLAYDRARFSSFMTAVVAAVAVVAVPLEVATRGEFIRSTFVMPSLTFGRESNWAHVGAVLGTYYPTWRSGLVIPLALAGAGFAMVRRLPIRPLVFLWLFDALLFLKTGQNDGGGNSYLWLHWMMTATLAGTGLVVLVDGDGSPIRRWLGSRRALRLVAPAAMGGLLCGAVLLTPRAFMWSAMASSRAGYAELAEAGRRHQALVASITRPYAVRWHAGRLASPIVRAGHILDHEVVTLQYAIAAGTVDTRTLARRFALGDYHFVQRTNLVDVDPISPILDACYRVLARSATPGLGRIHRVDILEYVGPYGSCRLAGDDRR